MVQIENGETKIVSSFMFDNQLHEWRFNIENVLLKWDNTGQLQYQRGIMKTPASSVSSLLFLLHAILPSFPFFSLFFELCGFFTQCSKASISSLYHSLVVLFYFFFLRPNFQYLNNYCFKLRDLSVDTRYCRSTFTTSKLFSLSISFEKVSFPPQQEQVLRPRKV